MLLLGNGPFIFLVNRQGQVLGSEIQYSCTPQRMFLQEKKCVEFHYYFLAQVDSLTFQVSIGVPKLSTHLKDLVSWCSADGSTTAQREAVSQLLSSVVNKHADG